MNANGTMNGFQHKDLDGDFLQVWGGERGAVIYAADHDPKSDAVMVAVRFDRLPDLIAALNNILDSEAAA